MEFWIKLLEVTNTSEKDARDDLNANCTHVGNDFWLYEGDLEALHEGITYTLIGEEAWGGYGDLSGSEIKKAVREIYNIDKCFLG